MNEPKSTGRASVEIPMEQWDWDHLTDLQKVVLGHPDYPPDVDALVAEVQHDPSLAKYSYNGSRTLLHEAAYARHEQLILLLIKAGADVNADPAYGTPLQRAGGDTHILGILLEAGANPNLQDGNGCTPLYWALLNHDLEAARFLIAHGAVPMDDYSRDAVSRLRTHRLLQ